MLIEENKIHKPYPVKKLPLESYEYRQTEGDFRQWLATLGYADSSVYGLPSYVREFFHFLEQQSTLSLQAATTAQVQAFFTYLSERSNQRRSGSLKASHLNKYIQALKLLAKFLVLTKQPTIHVEVKRLKATRSLPAILTLEEVQVLYECCDYTPQGLRDRVMLSLYYGCGLRRSEAVAVDVSDVLFRKKLIYVRKGKNYRERYVPMTSAIIADLRTYLYEARPMMLGRHGHEKYSSDALLVSEQGRRIDAQSLAIRLKQLLPIAGIDKPITLHSLRHSIATHLLQSGMKLQHIADFLGHQSLEATQLYTHIVANQSEHEPTG